MTINSHTKFNVARFCRTSNFILCQIKVKDLLVQLGLKDTTLSEIDIHDGCESVKVVREG